MFTLFLQVCWESEISWWPGLSLGQLPLLEEISLLLLQLSVLSKEIIFVALRELLLRITMVGCATITFDATSPLFAEAVACKLGIDVGIKFGFNKVIIEGDASNGIDAVLGASRDIPWSIRSVI